MKMRKISVFSVLALIASLGSSHAGGGKTPVVVELFTSQGCYSCPPAERYLGKLAHRSGVLALEFHVDYWDQLVYGSAGKWKDRFSSAVHTQRQRSYNQHIRGRGSVYTPQMVIDGRFEAVGSRERSVESAIRRTRSQARHPIAIEFGPGKKGDLSVKLSGKSSSKATIWLVTYRRMEKTEVRSGENKGKSLTSYNIVTDLQELGTWTGKPAQIDIESKKATAEGNGCAVLVQSAGTGPILGAAYCPARSS